MNVSCVIPFRSTGEYRTLLAEVVAGRVIACFPDWEIIIADNEGEFSRSKARNCGASAATGDILVFCDADTIWNPEYLTMALETTGSGWSLPYTMYYNLNQEATTSFLNDDWMDGIPRPEESQYHHALDYVISGTVVVPREAYDEVGGYDETFNGWGYEDDAFALSLTCLVAPVQRIDGFVCHLWHPVADNEAFGQPNIEHNRRLHQRYKHAVRSENEMRRLIEDRKRVGL